MSDYEQPEFKVVLPFKMIVSNELEQMRHDTFYMKEPETISWIKSFQDGDLFIDIGANIGIYSLYFASLYPKGLVIAAEPYGNNFAQIKNNVSMNQFTNIMPVCIAFSDETAYKPIYLRDIEIGSSGGQLDKPIDEHGVEFTIKVKGVDDVQAWVYSDFIKTFDNKPHAFTGKRTHIKIDIDGQEEKVLNGINDYTDIESMLIEFNNLTLKDLWISRMVEKGFTIKNKFNDMEDHSSKRRGELPVNIIFTKKVEDK